MTLEMTHSVPAIESLLPEADSPLFHRAVDEVAAIWHANPNASYEEVVFNYLVSFHLGNAEEDWGDQIVDDTTRTEIVEECTSLFVPNVVSETVSAFLQGKFPAGPKVDKCPAANRCSDPTCQFFHGPLCEFHAGMKVHFGGPKRGQKMTCGKGLDCPFDHAPEIVRKQRLDAGLQMKRFRHAPALVTEADILAVFPSITWRFADVYSYEKLTPAEMDLLEICLERSHEIGIVPLQGALMISTADFMDSRNLPPSPPFVAPAGRCPSAADGWEVAAPRRR